MGNEQAKIVEADPATSLVSLGLNSLKMVHIKVLLSRSRSFFHIATQIEILHTKACMLRKVAHPNVMKCVGQSNVDQKPGLVMPLASLGPLSGYTTKSKWVPFLNHFS